MTLSSFFTQWNDERAALGEITESSAQNYRQTLSSFIAAHGDTPIAKITAKDIKAYYIARLRTVSPSTVRTAHAMLVCLFRAAVAEGLVASSPMDKVAAPKPRETEKKALTEAQIRDLLAHCADKPFLRLVVRLALAAGLRRGELAALRWRDIDLEAGSLRVSRQIVRVDRREVEAQPKSEKSARAVALPRDLVDELRAIAGHPDMPVLLTSWGARPSLAYLSEIVSGALRAIGCGDGYSLHSTRHTHATHLLRASGNVKAVSRRLGHSDIRVTLRVYAHVLDGDDEGLAGVMGAMMS